MAESNETTAKPEGFAIPTSLKRLLDRLPAAEALQVIDDIGRVAWIVDNNNNNNNSKSQLESRLIDGVAKLPRDRLVEILESELKK